MEEITLKSKFIIFLLEYGDYPAAEKMFMTGCTGDKDINDGCEWEDLMDVIATINKYEIDTDVMRPLIKALLSGDLIDTTKTVAETIRQFNKRKFNLKS